MCLRFRPPPFCPPLLWLELNGCWLNLPRPHRPHPSQRRSWVGWPTSTVRGGSSLSALPLPSLSSSFCASSRMTLCSRSCFCACYCKPTPSPLHLSLPASSTSSCFRLIVIPSQNGSVRSLQKAPPAPGRGRTQQHYNGHFIHRDVQSVVLLRPPQAELIRAVAQISRKRDTNVPKDLTDEWRQLLCRDPHLTNLRRQREALSREIRFGGEFLSRGTEMYRRSELARRSAANDRSSVVKVGTRSKKHTTALCQSWKSTSRLIP
jgi:hypothetical protein